MNSSNSFNICPRCGNSNSLNAKYCSRCGAQLKVPQEAVVCPKCHTRNSSLANFCRNCGATLKVGAQTKICPRCGKEIGAEENVCACGYSFVTLQQTEPRPVNVASTNKSKKDKKRDKRQQHAVDEQQTVQQGGKTKTTYSKKGGRGFAIFATLLLAVFCYFIIAPEGVRGILPTERLLPIRAKRAANKRLLRPTKATEQPIPTRVELRLPRRAAKITRVRTIRLPLPPQRTKEKFTTFTA